MRLVSLVAGLGLAWLASPAAAQDPAALPPEAGASRCRISGEHVSGVVRVDLGTGQSADLPLVDVAASVVLAERPDEARFEVRSPLAFTGVYVPGERGAPGVHTARAYRSADGTVRYAAGVPVEARLAAGADDRATLRVPLEWGDGALEVDVPCSTLVAGAPRAGLAAPRPAGRGQFVRLAPDAVLRVAADPASAELARIIRTNAGAPVTLRGRMARPAGGVVRVSITLGPLAIEAYVTESAVTDAGRDLVPPGAPITRYAVASTLGEGERETREVTLPAGTPVFADRRSDAPWTHLVAATRVTLSRRVGSTYRFALEFTHATFPTFPCRSDGVAGYPACGDANALPRMGLMSCPGGSCTQVAYVDAPSE